MASELPGEAAELALAELFAAGTPADVDTEGFAGRTERELMATGERARKRTVETRDDLTPQEAQIARLARDGLSNAEIGARIFVSQTTVAYHLRNVFSKLNIASRHQLATVLRDSGA